MEEEGKEDSEKQLVGRMVKKLFPGFGYFFGKVLSYNESRRYFRVKYDDGDREELELRELQEILVDGGSPLKRQRGRPRKTVERHKQDVGAAISAIVSARDAKKYITITTAEGKDKERDKVDNEENGISEATCSSDGKRNLRNEVYDSGSKAITKQTNDMKNKHVKTRLKYEERQDERKRKRENDREDTSTQEQENCEGFEPAALKSEGAVENVLYAELEHPRVDGTTLLPEKAPAVKRSRGRPRLKTTKANDKNGIYHENHLSASPSHANAFQQGNVDKTCKNTCAMDNGTFKDAVCPIDAKNSIRSKGRVGKALGRKQKLASSETQTANGESTPRRSSRRLQDQSTKQPSSIDRANNSECEDKSRVTDRAVEGSVHAHFIALPPLQPLPPASCNFEIQEDLLADLFGVYTFLRSFSWALFLSPFGLEDFISCLATKEANPLIDNLHLSLLQILYRHMQRSSQGGTETASTCLKQRDWNMLDVITWPVYLIGYLLNYGFSKEFDQKLSKLGVGKNEYYKLEASSKLLILNFLCDHVMETDEIRTEVARRVTLEPEVDQADILSPVQEKAKPQTRSSETEARKKLFVDNDDLPDPSCNDADNNMAVAIDSVEVTTVKPPCDWNSDDCVLCGMHGSLICCDGCPAAYHSRCLGIPKYSLPDGDWFCPECCISKDAIKPYKGLRGSEFLGIDPHGRRYTSTCGYLLVLESSLDSIVSMKCYGASDLPCLMKFFQSSGPLFKDIQAAVQSHFGITNTTEVQNLCEVCPSCGPDHTSAPEAADELVHVTVKDPEPFTQVMGAGFVGSKEAMNESQHDNASDGQKGNSTMVLATNEGKNLSLGRNANQVLSDAIETHQFNVVNENNTQGVMVPSISGRTFGDGNHMSSNVEAKSCLIGDGICVSTEYNSNCVSAQSMGELISSFKDPKGNQNIAEHLLQSDKQASKLDTHFGHNLNGNVPVINTDTFTSGVNQLCAEGHLGEDNNAFEVSSLFTAISNNCVQAKENVGDGFIRVVEGIEVLIDQSMGTQGGGALISTNAKGVEKGRLKDNLEASSCFTYINQYALGDAAAAAAVILATVMPVGAQGTEEKAPRKTDQMKVLCQGPPQFYWPSFRKKSMEVPKEKCGWCSGCQSKIRKPCILNLAAAQLAAGAARVSSGLRPVKESQNHLPAVVAYLLYMEESLNGLLCGPWEKSEERKSWRKRLAEAESLKHVKSALLEMEANLRPIALSSSWSTHVEDSPELVPSSNLQMNAVCPSVQKGIGGKRGRKTVATVGHVGGSAWGVHWWRGGRLARKYLDWERLPKAIVKKAARQGGKKKIAGLCYTDGPEIPRRTAECAWKARVESACHVSQLALQIRILDSIIKWKELLLSEETVSYLTSIKFLSGKRNAILNPIIHEKDTEDGISKYLVDSGKSLEELKNSIKPKTIESLPKFLKALALDTGSGEVAKVKNRVWLNEFQVPLFLLKNFEERKRKQFEPKVMKVGTGKKKRKHAKLGGGECNSVLGPKSSSAVQKKRLISWTCTCCSMEIIASQIALCDRCKGTFHKHCMQALEGSKTYVCTGCTSWKFGKRSRKRTYKLAGLNGEVCSPLEDYGTSDGAAACFYPFTESQLSVTERKKLPVRRRSLKAVCEQDERRQGTVRWDSAMNAETKDHIRYNIHFSIKGVTWKKNEEDTDLTFRLDRLIMGGCQDINGFEGPKCCLCSQPYDPALLYVGCEVCEGWFHADALGITMDNLSKVARFKCCKCRKIRSPECPHSFVSKGRAAPAPVHASFPVPALASAPLVSEVDKMATLCYESSMIFPNANFGACGVIYPQGEVVMNALELDTTVLNESVGSQADHFQQCTVNNEDSKETYGESNFKAQVGATDLSLGPEGGPVGLSFTELLASEDDIVEETVISELGLNLDWSSGLVFSDNLGSGYTLETSAVTNITNLI